METDVNGGAVGRDLADPGPDGTRRRLYEAALQAFAEKGFHGTTTRDIAARAGMSPAALYVHHRSKEEVLHLISATGHARVLRLVEEAVASSADPVVALERLVVEFARHHAVHHTEARVLNYELNALAPEHLAEVMEMRRAMDLEVRELVRRGVATGAFSTSSPPLSAAALLSLGIDIARWYGESIVWKPDEIAEHYRELALRMVGVREPEPWAGPPEAR